MLSIVRNLIDSEQERCRPVLRIVIVIVVAVSKFYCAVGVSTPAQLKRTRRTSGNAEIVLIYEQRAVCDAIEK